MRALWWVVCLGWCVAAVGAEPGVEAVPGRPWTAVVPDPDSYDWSRRDRPGYRYRGMEPIHQRFHEHVQAKRRKGQPLSAAERMIIRTLTAARRWPEPPQPNEFWAAYMRWLRRQTSDELNTAQHLLLTELMQRGLIAMDRAPNETVARAAEYLRGQPFECRNWFERHLAGRVEPWLDYALASHGYALAPPTVVGGESFPAAGDANGMSITYKVSGCRLGAVTERLDPRRDMAGARTIEGTFTPPCTLTISGQVTSGGRGAVNMVSVWQGDEREFQRQQVPAPPAGTGRASFQVTIAIPAGAERAGFEVALNGNYAMGQGIVMRDLYVRGSLVAAPPPEQQAAEQREAARRAADDAWRAHVEETLAKLGYSDAPEGRALAALRDALHGTAADWRRYVDQQQRQLGYDTAPVAQEYRALWRAMEPTAPAPAPAPAADQGGALEVGTGLVDGQVTGVAQVFDRPTRLTCRAEHHDLPANTKLVAVWSRDGRDLIRSERGATGTGWVSFSLLGAGGQPLTPGGYQVVITIGERRLGQARFTVR